MKTLRALAVDDERLARVGFCRELTEMNGVEEAGEYGLPIPRGRRV